MTIAAVLDVATVILLVAGAFFFLAGTVGLVRFPDVYARLHALTKADNLGLGLIAAACALQTSLPQALKMVLAWLLVLASAAVAAHLMATAALRSGIEPELSSGQRASFGDESAERGEP
jgi:multicomponent Na+:H+ antiporter subunit G